MTLSHICQAHFVGKGRGPHGPHQPIAFTILPSEPSDWLRHGFSGGCAPPEIICTPPEAFGTAPQSFCTPANYTYFDLIVSYLIILTTKFVKSPILWSQISPCRPRKQILINFFLGFSGRCHHTPAKASSSTPQIFIHPPRTKIWKSVSGLTYHKNSSWMNGKKERVSWIYFQSRMKYASIPSNTPPDTATMPKKTPALARCFVWNSSIANTKDNKIKA
jgi:hypothetical protein